MEKIEFKNSTYYFNQGKLYDDAYFEVSKNESDVVLNYYFENYNYQDLEEAEFIKFVKNVKLAGFYEACLKFIKYGLGKFTSSIEYYKTVFPIITSCYRALNQSQKAIDFWMENKKLYVSCLSAALLTSLAAAYCDVKNYELAKKCADRAYYMQGGGQGYKNELSLVYKRIEKETKED